MKGIKLKILLIFLMLVPVPFSCKDKCESRDFYVLPYYEIQKIEFSHADWYDVNSKTGKLMFDTISQDFANRTYYCENMALFFEAPHDELLFHSQNIMKSRFDFTREAFACTPKRPGYAGTKDLVDKIWIKSTFPFTETHGAHVLLDDIVWIFAYTTNGQNPWMRLREYNELSPRPEAPMRFYLIFRCLYSAVCMIIDSITNRIPARIKGHCAGYCLAGTR